MINARFGFMGVVAVCGMVACSADREVEVQGSVSAAALTNVSGEVLLQFYEIDADDDTARRHLQDVTLAELGDFKQTVAVEGSELIIVAINDRDGNGECSTGEAWAEVTTKIADDDTTEPVAIVLQDQPCAPAAD